MRLAIAVAVAAVVAAVAVGSAVAAAPVQLRVSACVDTATPPHMTINQTWKNVGPADFTGPYDIVYDFISSLNPFTADSLDIQYIPTPGGFVSGSQFDVFNSWIGTSGFVPWNAY